MDGADLNDRSHGHGARDSQVVTTQRSPFHPHRGAGADPFSQDPANRSTAAGPRLTAWASVQGPLSPDQVDVLGKNQAILRPA